MKAIEKDWDLANRIERQLGVSIDTDDCRTLRRAERALQRWAERECGDGSNWHIQRDEETGVPYEHYCGPSSFAYKPRKVADLEAGALRRAKAVADRYGLQIYHQTDPRGCALYLGRDDMNNRNYSTAGAGCCV